MSTVYGMHFITEQIIIFIVILMSSMISGQQCSDSVLLIHRLNEYFEFDHNIYLMDTTVDLGTWFPMSSSDCNLTLVNFTPQSIYTFDEIPRFGNITDRRETSKAKVSKNPFLIIVVDGGSIFQNETELWAQVKFMSNMKIGVVFARSIKSLDIVEQLFRWSWSAGIVNIFCAFHLNVEDGEPSIYKYNPFGTFHLVDLTGSDSLRDYFSDKVPNYGKRPIRFLDVLELGHSISPQFWHTVTYVFNATMLRVSTNAAGLDKFDPEEYTILSENIVYDDPKIYPHRQTVMLLIVPHAKPYSNFVAFLQNNTWSMLFVYVIVVSVTSSLLLIVSRYMQQKKILLLECVADVVNLLINDNTTIRYGNLHLADVFIIAPLTFVGLIVMNGIVSLLQSYLTSPIYQHQIDSLQDLYNSSIPILIPEFSEKDAHVHILQEMTKYARWADKIHGTKEMQKEIDTFNNSIAFFLLDDRARAYFEVQRRMGLKVYHVLGDTFFIKHLISQPSSPQFPFNQYLNDMVLRLGGAGLFDKWLDEEIETSVQVLWKESFNSQLKVSDESDVGKFSVPTIVWCGWIASAIVFACEIIWKKMNLRRR